MFGYVGPDTSKMSKEEVAQYKAFYCGSCKASGRVFGQWSRFATNFDITFFSIVMYDLLKISPTFCREVCILNPVIKRNVTATDDLAKTLASFNVLFVYHSLLDAQRDGISRGKRAFKKRLKPAFELAKQQLPKIDQILSEYTHKLHLLETQNSSNFDEVCDCFASILRDSAKELLPNPRDVDLEFFYHLGKWIYIADALDDIEQDAKKNNYNPFLASMKGFTTRQEFFATNKDDIFFVVHITINKIIDCFNAMQIAQSHNLIKNVVYYGLRAKADEILSSPKKLRQVKF